jgi:hypothetical protein
MFSLKSDEHLLTIAKELYEDKYFSDIIFIVNNTSYYGHSSLIFQHVDTLANLCCDICKYGHDKIVIFLPGVEEEFLEIALLEFYLRGDPVKLRSIFNVTSVKTETIQSDVSKDTDEFPIEIYNDSASSIDSEIKCAEAHLEDSETDFEQEKLLQNTSMLQVDGNSYKLVNEDIPEQNTHSEQMDANIEDILKEPSVPSSLSPVHTSVSSVPSSVQSTLTIVDMPTLHWVSCKFKSKK